MNLFSLIIEDLQTQREGLFAQGFWALLVYRLSYPRTNCKVRALRIVWRLVNVTLQKIIEILAGISIPETASIGRRLNIEHFGGIIIHGSAVIGDDCQIRQGVTIGNRGSDDPMGAPNIGNRVDIGAGAKLIGRIRIGSDVRIGANAVVTKDVASNSIAVGIPAKVIAKPNL